MKHKRLAIIGASTGQLPLCKKAHEMGLETYCFAWPEGAVCKEYVDHFIPISIFEKDEIVERCKELHIDGVVSNASEKTASITAYVAEKLGKIGTPYQVFKNIQNKEYVRRLTNGITALHPVKYTIGNLDTVIHSLSYPFVLKPTKGAAKKGVNFVQDASTQIKIEEDLKQAIFMAEEFIEGKEYSVETISFHQRHQVIQITEKIGTGAPHFVELEHHQPANIPCHLKRKIQEVIPKVLKAIGFTNGAAHIEIKIDQEENLYLIEVNPRGGGDFISNELVELSTDCDYLKQMILVALDEFQPIEVHNTAYAGVYFLSAYSSRLLPYFNNPATDWLIERHREHQDLTLSTSNYDRDGYILYRANQKIEL